MAQAKITWTGIAREADAGTAEDDPTMFFPVKSKMTNKTKYVYVDEDRNTRDVNNDRVATVRMANISLDGSVYTNSIPYLLLGFMGGITSTQPDSDGAPLAYQHAMALTDVPPSFTMFKGYDDAAAHYWAYTVIQKLSFKWAAEDKVLEYSAGLQGQYKVDYGNTPSVSYSGTPKPLAGYVPTIKFATVQSMDVTTMELDFEQKVTLFYPSAGSRSFAKVYFGDRKATVKYDARFDADTDFETRFVSETDQALDIVFNGVDLSTAQDASTLETIQFTMPIVGTDDADIEPNKDYWGVKYAGTAGPGATKNSLFTAKVINTVAAYTS